MAFSPDRIIRTVFIAAAVGFISLEAIHGWESLYKNSRLPREIASFSDDQKFYRLYAACGLYNLSNPNAIQQEQRMIQLNDENQTVVAHTNDLDVNIGIYPERYLFRGVAERLGYFRYEGVFGNKKISGGIFCPSRI